jgi:hypothetical protein
MKVGLRLICLIIALCLGLNSFYAVKAYAYRYDLPDRSGVKRSAFITTKALPKTVSNDDMSSLTDTLFKSDNDENLWYCKKIGMKKEHQKVLWDLCKSRGLNYVDMLALIYTESNFDEKCVTGSNKGYFQIGKTHFSNLSKALKTPNKPMDGSININWGTAMFSWILEDERVKKYTGKKKLEVALSIFQRGTGGYDRSGISYKFLKAYYKKREIVSSYFK